MCFLRFVTFAFTKMWLYNAQTFKIWLLNLLFDSLFRVCYKHGVV